MSKSKKFDKKVDDHIGHIIRQYNEVIERYSVLVDFVFTKHLEKLSIGKLKDHWKEMSVLEQKRLNVLNRTEKLGITDSFSETDLDEKYSAFHPVDKREVVGDEEKAIIINITKDEIDSIDFRLKAGENKNSFSLWVAALAAGLLILCLFRGEQIIESLLVYIVIIISLIVNLFCALTHRHRFGLQYEYLSYQKECFIRQKNLMLSGYYPDLDKEKLYIKIPLLAYCMKYMQAKYIVGSVLLERISNNDHMLVVQIYTALFAYFLLFLFSSIRIAGLF